MSTPPPKPLHLPRAAPHLFSSNHRSPKKMAHPRDGNMPVRSAEYDAEVQAHAAEREAHAATKADLHRLHMELLEERRQRDMRQLERDTALSKLDLMKTECLLAIEDRARLREENIQLHALIQAAQADHRNTETRKADVDADGSAAAAQSEDVHGFTSPSNEEDDENAGARDSASEADVNASKVALRAWRAIVPKSRRSPRPRTKSTGFWSHLQYAAKGPLILVQFLNPKSKSEATWRF
ncbi:hypothetical protein B0H13DRAFT_2262777 [Mycena leptocephala]|nr:hypothetical protein B0H13DRAFT_2262777 [Mycena leptocephala]